MTAIKKTKMEQLQQLLDRVGSDIAGWPSEAQGLKGFIKDNPQAKKLYQEARALDQLLDLSANAPDGAPLDLQQAILADFADLHADIEPVVVPFSSNKNTPLYLVNSANSWMAGAAMAACFAVGIYLGGAGIGDWPLDLATNLASLAGNEDQFAEIADAVISSSFEEDLL